MTLRHLSRSSTGFGVVTNYMHSNDVMTKNTPNELSVKMAVIRKMKFMKHAIDKAGKSLGYNEVKELQWKVIAEVVSSQDFFTVLLKGFGLNVINP